MHRRVLVVLLGVLAGCGSPDAIVDDSARARPCAGVLSPDHAEAHLPSGIPAGPSRATFYLVQKQGSTSNYFAYASGTDLVKARDEIQLAFTKAGFEILSADAESGAEAEFQWRGPQAEGSVQVVPLCRDTIRMRYRVGAKV